jgi:shingomyelin synthase
VATPSKKAQPGPKKAKKGPKSQKTHSRESSGASNLSVRFTVNDETISTSEAQVPDGPKGLGLRSSDEDITLSDRLSQDLDLEDDDGFEPGSKSCESIPHDRLTPFNNEGDIRMLPSDSKSQNSDYGSFCHTPSDTFGAPSAAPPGGGPSGDSLNHQKDLQEDNETLEQSHQSDTQREPLLPPRSHDLEEDLEADDTSSDDDAGANSSGYMRRKTRLYHQRLNPEAGEASEDSTDGVTDDIKGEPVKTLLAGIFLIFAWVATTTSLALTHEYVPEVSPLPDLVLDRVQYQSWGLDASEITIMICTLLAFLVSLFHKHRFIVLRRIFLLVGIHYYYRAVTMFVTVLPNPNEHYKCAPKSENITALIIFQRVLKLLSGMGLSINGKHIYCGDYIYSGHTMTLIMTYLVIKEYSPKKWYLFHWLSLGLTAFGVVALLLARGHYSIDVVIAYWITTRLWWTYHTLTKHEVLKSTENEDNYISRAWWWYIFIYFEKRVPTQLPREYGWPLPEKLLQWNGFRRRNLQSNEDLEAGLRPQEE